MTARTVHSIHSIRFIAFVAMAVAAVGCSNPAANLATSPSEIPDSLAAQGGLPTVRYFGAEVTPISVPAGSTTSFSITIENCNGAGTCDGVQVTSNNQAIGHATVTVPAAFTGVSNLVVSNSTPADAWLVSLVSGTIQLSAPAGNKRLDRGESVTVTFDATAACVAGSHTWTTAAFQDVDVDLNGTPYTLVGGQPAVSVTGGCVTECTVRGQGYWEHHFSNWPSIGDGLALGNRVYSAAELLSILEQNPVGGNGLIALAHQLVSAKLNIANGENGSAIAATIAAADALIGSLVVPPVGGGTLAPSQTGSLTQALDAFNSQCEDSVPLSSVPRSGGRHTPAAAHSSRYPPPTQRSRLLRHEAARARFRVSWPVARIPHRSIPRASSSPRVSGSLPCAQSNAEDQDEYEMGSRDLSRGRDRSRWLQSREYGVA